MLPLAQLQALIPTLPTQAIALVGFRAITFASLVGHPQVNPLYAAGAAQNGARYTPIGGPDSIYVAEDPLTALAEVGQFSALIAAHHPNQLVAQPPTMVLSIETTLASVLTPAKKRRISPPVCA